MDYAWGANGLDAIITQVFLENLFSVLMSLFILLLYAILWIQEILINIL